MDVWAGDEPKSPAHLPRRSNEMNPWWLLLIVPVSFGFGFFVSALLCMAACGNCKEAMRYRDSLIDKKGFEAGFKEGITSSTKVG
jgi:hypothetical protein